MKYYPISYTLVKLAYQTEEVLKQWEHKTEPTDIEEKTKEWKTKKRYPTQEKLHEWEKKAPTVTEEEADKKFTEYIRPKLSRGIKLLSSSLQTLTFTEKDKAEFIKQLNKDLGAKLISYKKLEKKIKDATVVDQAVGSNKYKQGVEELFNVWKQNLSEMASIYQDTKRGPINAGNVFLNIVGQEVKDAINFRGDIKGLMGLSIGLFTGLIKWLTNIYKKSSVKFPKGGFKIIPGSEVKATGTGYVYVDTIPRHPDAITLPDRNRAYVYKHRILMENHLSRYLLPGEEVHHKDENRENNKLSNLELSSKSEHPRQHAKGKGQLKPNKFWEKSPLNKPKRKHMKKTANLLRIIATRVQLAATITTWKDLVKALEQLILKSENKPLPANNFFETIKETDNINFIKEAVGVLQTLHHLVGYMIESDIKRILQAKDIQTIKSSLHHWIQTIQSMSEV